MPRRPPPAPGLDEIARRLAATPLTPLRGGNEMRVSEDPWVVMMIEKVESIDGIRAEFSVLLAPDGKMANTRWMEDPASIRGVAAMMHMHRRVAQLLLRGQRTPVKDAAALAWIQRMQHWAQHFTTEPGCEDQYRAFMREALG
jgi:hypothetical protein